MQGGTPLSVGPALVQTVRHFFPEFNVWLDALPDGRDPERIIYEGRFLAWWGLALFLCQLGSRRQLDYQLDSVGTHVLDNLNRLAETQHTTRPVHDTLDYFLGHSQAAALLDVRTHCVRRLLRMKALDSARLLGHMVLVLDATGVLCWRRRHCNQCLTQQQASGTLYRHEVLEAMFLGPADLVVPVASAFIENADLEGTAGQSAEQIKQDCELKAFSRLAPRLKKTFPQLALVLAGDSLYACGRVLQVAQEYTWKYVLTFKEGRLPALWREFQRLLPLCPGQQVEQTDEDGLRRVYRWVHNLEYQDDAGRWWKVNALDCTETRPGQEPQYFAWITNLPVSAKTVAEIAQKGGRARWNIENEGFNRQKNSGLNLEHVYSTDPEKWKAYYHLLQIAFLLTQLLERGSLLRRLAEEAGRTVRQWFGSLKNIAQRLLESVRYGMWPAACFDAAGAARLHCGFDTS